MIQQVPLIGIYLREMKTYVYMKTFMQMFIAILFIIAKTKNKLGTTHMSIHQ